MSASLAPARGEASLPPLDAGRLLRALALSVLAAALFWSPLLLGGALRGGDWASHHFHYFDWVRISFAEYGVVPLYMAHAWITPNFAANAEAPTLGPLVWLLCFLSTNAYLKLLLVVFTAAGLFGMVALLRDLAVSAPVAAFAAAVFAWGGFFVSHLTYGHPWAMGAHLLPLLCWLFRRAALGSDGALVAAAALDASTILGGQHQPFIWQNLLLGGWALLWALRAGAGFPLRRLALLWVLAAGLGAVKLVPLWVEFRDYAPTARIQGLPLPSLLASLTLPGRGRGFVDPAIAYEHGAGWWEYAFYVGPLGLLGLAAGCAAARGAWPWLALGGFFLVLSVEPLGVWPWLQDLPVWRSQRCPSRFLVLAIFAASVVGAVGLERLRRLAAGRRPRAALAVAWAVVALAGLDLWRESLPWQQAAVGEPIASVDPRARPAARQPPGARLERVEFSPNRRVYRFAAEAPARFVLPLRFGRRLSEWEVEGARALAAGEWLALGVPAGSGEVRLRYRPPGLRPGLALSAATLAAVALWIGLRVARLSPGAARR